MAECHPVGFQWVMEAKARGAKVFHVDPRFTRTSAMADRHVPIRAGSDIVLLGALINHVLTERAATSASTCWPTPTPPTIVSEDFRDTEDLDGLFSGFDPETRTYDPTSWAYEGRRTSRRRASGRRGGAAGSTPRRPGPRRTARAAPPRTAQRRRRTRR